MPACCSGLAPKSPINGFLQTILAAIALALFAWLLTLQSSAAGRTYAAYGGMYITVALAWLYLVQGIAPTRWDLTGAGVALVGMAIIALQPSTHS